MNDDNSSLLDAMATLWVIIAAFITVFSVLEEIE